MHYISGTAVLYCLRELVGWCSVVKQFFENVEGNHKSAIPRQGELFY